jgi:hypothetical protein
MVKNKKYPHSNFFVKNNLFFYKIYGNKYPIYILIVKNKK